MMNIASSTSNSGGHVGDAQNSKGRDGGVGGGGRGHHPAAAPSPGTVAHPSKEVRELHHKLLKDFPNGWTAVMSRLLDGGASLSGAALSSVSLLMDQEWRAFLQSLGGAVVDGFHDRVSRYDKEPQRLGSGDLCGWPSNCMIVWEGGNLLQWNTRK